MAMPSQLVPNFDHLVTQWMSTVIFSRGSATNSSQVHRADCPSGLRSVRSHTDRAVRGVGPAESTGKSRVSYWPGGRRAAAPSGCRRPRKPREMGVMGRSHSSLRPVLLHAHRSGCEGCLHFVGGNLIPRVLEGPAQREVSDLLPTGLSNRVVSPSWEFAVRSHGV